MRARCSLPLPSPALLLRLLLLFLPLVAFPSSPFPGDAGAVGSLFITAAAQGISGSGSLSDDPLVGLDVDVEGVEGVEILGSFSVPSGPACTSRASPSRLSGRPAEAGRSLLLAAAAVEEAAEPGGLHRMGGGMDLDVLVDVGLDLAETDPGLLSTFIRWCCPVPPSQCCPRGVIFGSLSVPARSAVRRSAALAAALSLACSTRRSGTMFARMFMHDDAPDECPPRPIPVTGGERTAAILGSYFTPAGRPEGMRCVCIK